MPTTKEQIIEDINKCHAASLNEGEVARKVFIFDLACVFNNDKILGFRILNSISERFRIPLACIKVAGSAQIGYSSTKKRDFIAGESDLDVAIVSPSLFQKYSEVSYKTTCGYTNLTGFADNHQVRQFQSYLHIGYFRPDLMPRCSEKTEWFNFFKTLTDRYSAIFKSVSGGIYFSELFFEGKQTAVIKTLKG